MSQCQKMREVHWPSALPLADLFNQTLFSDHPTLSWTSGPAGMIDGVMNVHGHQQERTGVDRLTQVANSRTELKKIIFTQANVLVYGVSSVSSRIAKKYCILRKI